MATEPNTIIRIHHSIPFDKDYKHTKYFASKAEQETYFLRNFKQYDANSFQRINKNTLRIQEKAEDILDYNYLSFKNINHGNRWIYAFILSADYINENTTEITYKIDVMQTYFFSYDSLGNQLVHFDDSFVEREMSATDNVGDNLIDEKLELGEFVCTDEGATRLTTDGYDVVIAFPYDESNPEEFEPFDGGFYAGTYTGVKFFAFHSVDQTEMAALRTFLQRIADEGKVEDIVSIFAAPHGFWQAGGYADVKDTPTEYTVQKNKYANLFGNYQPKNNKLYTYPYTFMYVTNPSGKSAVFRYEFFGTILPTFNMTATYSLDTEVILYPTSYKGVTNNLQEKFVLAGYPMFAYNVNAYQNWIANSKNSRTLTGISAGFTTILGAAGTAVSFLTGNPLGVMAGAAATSNGLMQIGGLLAQDKDKQVDPVQAQGSVSNNTMLAMNKFDYHFYNKHITEEFARIIDEYFSVYGYKTNRVKIPNLAVRPHWNYVKTVSASIYGKANANVISEIESIFNNGITLWKDDDYYGVYKINGELRTNI